MLVDFNNMVLGLMPRREKVMPEKTLKEFQAEYVEVMRHITFGDQTLLNMFSHKQLEDMQKKDSRSHAYAITNHLVEAARLREIIINREAAIEACR